MEDWTPEKDDVEAAKEPEPTYDTFPFKTFSSNKWLLIDGKQLTPPDLTFSYNTDYFVLKQEEIVAVANEEELLLQEQAKPVEIRKEVETVFPTETVAENIQTKTWNDYVKTPEKPIWLFAKVSFLAGLFSFAWVFYFCVIVVFEVLKIDGYNLLVSVENLNNNWIVLIIIILIWYGMVLGTQMLVDEKVKRGTDVALLKLYNQAKRRAYFPILGFFAGKKLLEQLGLVKAQANSVVLKPDLSLINWVEPTDDGNV